MTDSDAIDSFRRSASYVDSILKGANPAELPVQQPMSACGEVARPTMLYPRVVR
jgi:hypothetical protein